MMKTEIETLSYLNTDVEVYRSSIMDGFEKSVFITDDGRLGINNKGNVVVLGLNIWHRLGLEFIEKDWNAPDANEDRV